MAIKWLNVIGFIVLCGFLVVIGFMAYIVYMNRLDVLSSLHDMVTTRIPALYNLVSQIQSTWTSIPDPIRGIILLGIPTLFATFFAWTKSRAMQKLQQTQVEAATAQKNLETQIVNVATSKDIQIEALQKQLANPDLSTLTEAQKLVTIQADQLRQQATEIQRVITERNTLAQLVESMKLKTYETTVVK